MITTTVGDHQLVDHHLERKMIMVAEDHPSVDHHQYHQTTLATVPTVMVFINSGDHQTPDQELEDQPVHTMTISRKLSSLGLAHVPEIQW